MIKIKLTHVTTFGSHMTPKVTLMFLKNTKEDSSD
jgi:hypothetical protein